MAARPRITGGQAAEAIRSSGSKISRIESGLLPVRQRDLDDLLTLYGVTDKGERESALALARESEQAGWWDGQNLPAHLTHILNVEAAATTIFVYDSQAIPALLQTPEYAQAVALRSGGAAALRGGLRPDILARRRNLLLKTGAPRLWALIDQAVLERSPSKDPGVMAGQIGRLAAAATGRITVQIVPSRSPSSLLAAGPFTILRIGGTDLPDLVFLEQLTTISTVDRRDVSRYWEIFDRLAAVARDPSSSQELLRHIAQTGTQ